MNIITTNSRASSTPLPNPSIVKQILTNAEEEKKKKQDDPDPGIEDLHYALVKMT